MDYGIWQGAEKATGNMLNVGMGLMKYKQDQAIEQQKLQAYTEHMNRQNKLLDMTIQEQQRDNELIPIHENLSRLGFKSAEEQNLFLEKLNPLDVEDIGGVKYIKRKTGVENFKTLAVDPEFNIKLGIVRTDNVNKSLAQIDAVLSNPESKLKPEQIQQLQKQKDEFIQHRTQLANAIKMEQMKIKAKNLIPMGKGGLYDAATGEIISSPEQDNNVSSSLREYETVSGMSPDKRGTPEYRKGYYDFLRQKKTSNGDYKPTDKDKSYASYVDRWKEEVKQGLHKGKRMMSRYEFENWQAKEQMAGKEEAKADAQIDKIDKQMQRIREIKLKKDLIKNGYSEKQADDYISRAKALGKL